MSWTFVASRLTACKKLDQLKALLTAELPKLWKDARSYEPVVKLPYGTTVRPSGDTRQVQSIEVTDAVAFTVANPSNPREGVEIILDFLNSATGTIGAVTFGSDYWLDGAFVKPDADQHAVYQFAWVP